MHSKKHVRARFATVACAASLIACAQTTLSQTITPRQSVTPSRTTLRDGHPGFDLRVYPGDSAMHVWRAASPYEWVGYYLIAPCQTGTTWVGKRAALQNMGWGTAVIFLGEQDWAAPRDTTAGPQCTAANLTTSKGTADAARADSTASAEGFAPGTIIFLDVERVEAVSPSYESYLRAWMRGIFARKHFMPGVYVHEKNADVLRSILAAEYASAGRTSPPVWIAARPTVRASAPTARASASASSFDINSAPSASGFSYANIWQGLFNTAETWGGVTLTIDANVATRANPSSGN